jgi:hypothetical protein
VTSDFSDRNIPKETIGTVVECYDNPEGYAVDLAIPDDTNIGEFAYENVILTPVQFRVVSVAQQRHVNLHHIASTEIALN